MYIEQYLGAFENYAERNALTCLATNKTLTYKELDRMTNRLSNKLKRDGLRKGDVVMVCLFNTFHLPVAMLGSWKNLQIFSPINFRLSPGEVGTHLEDSEPKVFIYDSDLDETINKALQLSRYKPDVLISTQKSCINRSIEFDDYIRNASEEDPNVIDRIKKIDLHHDEIERLYTSGTTGLPKGVKFSSYSLLNIAFKMLYNNNYTSKDRLMNLTPWFHQGGLATVVQPGLLAGAHIFGLKKFNPDEALDYVEKHKITFLAGAPATFNAMVTAQKERTRDLSNIRLIHSMGSASSSREFLLWQEIFAKRVVNSYGTTEMASVLCLRSDIHSINEKAGSAGRPFIFAQARVVKFDGENMKAEPDDLVRRNGQEMGQIITRSLGMFDGYHNRPEEEAKKLFNGWFYTGDTATIDKDGFITVQGRTDDMFVSGGENIFPQPVEDVLEKHPKVRECIVVGMNDKKWGHVTVAYIVSGDEVPTVEELDKHCLDDPGLAKYKRPRYYQFVNELPYTSTGKKLRYLMKERANLERDKFIAAPSKN
ncbi:MAG: AMP-binding protein [Thermodesulfobacteriota bacterium]